MEKDSEKQKDKKRKQNKWTKKKIMAIAFLASPTCMIKFDDVTRLACDILWCRQ